MSENNNASPLRFTLVGAGAIAQTHLDGLKEVPRAQLVSVAEPRGEAGRAAAEVCGGRHFSRHDDPELLDGVDAAIICTPPATHHEIARYFLDNGKHVLCEKPLTLTTAHAEDLVTLARERDLTLMMASKFRYVQDVIQAKALIASGMLGDIVLYENVFCGQVDMSARWNSDAALSGGGVLIDNGCHSVDIARYLLGPLSAISVQRGVSAQGLAVEDTVHIHFRSEGGVIGSVDLSWSVNKYARNYIGLYGSAGAIEVGWPGSRQRKAGSPDWTPFGGGYDKVGAFAGQLANFVGVVRGEVEPLITPADALASVRVIEAAYRSLDRDDWIEVGQ